MTRAKVKEVIYDLTKNYKDDIISLKKVSNYKLRDLLVTIFTTKCPNSIYRNKDAIIVLYRSKQLDLEFVFNKLPSQDKVYVDINTKCSDVILEKENFWIILPNDSDALKRKVKETLEDFYKKKG